MNKIFRNGLMALAAGALAVSCANYNDLGGFSAEPDPSYTDEYAGLNPVKSYINKNDYPNMSMETNIALSTYNKQGMDHAAAVTNFNGVGFGYTFMPGNIVSKKGYMNFMALKEALNHSAEIGVPVYGSPIVANDQQPDDWFAALTAPIEIQVLPINDVDLDYSTVDEFTGTNIGKTKPAIEKNFDEKGNALMVPKRSKVYIIEGFPVDPQGFYTITFTVRGYQDAKKKEMDKEENINCTFADSVVNTGKDKEGKLIKKNFTIRPGGWQTVKVEWVPAKAATQGYLMIEGNLNTILYIRNVHVEHTPDNHREQSKEEKNENMQYALQKWCDGLMEANAGRIKSFDLVDKALDTKVLDGVTYEGQNVLDLKHSTDKIFWQDYLEEGNKSGSELYAATVSKVAKEAFEKRGGNSESLKFFISETGLEDQQRLASLKYWIKTWEGNGAKIDGINAELNLTYSEDATKQNDNETVLKTYFDNLKATGKLIRLSNFDIKYEDAEGAPVTADKITKAQRQKLANYYAYVIQTYLARIPAAQQAGLCKGNIFDTSSGKGDPVGLWSKAENGDWLRNATYEAFCNALSGK
jgi:hypothetical protein